MRIFFKIIMTSITIFCAYNPLVYGQTNALFNSAEFRSTELSAFKKWAGLRARQESDQNYEKTARLTGVTKPCRRTKNFQCAIDEWSKTIESIRNKSSSLQMKTVNAHLSKARYITDMVNWQQKDYWATIRQFFNKDGDCEDYAIMKYFTLKFLGFNDNNMRLVSVVDTIRGIGHSVLAVNTNAGVYVLDSLSNGLFRDVKYAHYVPKYSVNQSGRWIHARSQPISVSYVAQR